MIPAATAAELIERAGAVPHLISVDAFAPALDPDPALLLGRQAGTSPFVLILDAPEYGAALFHSSRSPALINDQLSERELERLRGEALTPSGADDPVGQIAAARAADTSIPYAPPVQPLDTAESTNADVELDPRDVSEVEEAPCGNPECVVIEGQELHVPGCPAGDA
jgi:hypothetical protein